LNEVGVFIAIQRETEVLQQMNRIAVIADIVASRAIKDRPLIQKQLGEVLAALNARSESGILSPYTITLGDEFQAVFSTADSLFRDAFTILAALYPVRVRFSFGVGTIDTPINFWQAIGMDGPAFHHAREGIEELKRIRGSFDVNGVETPDQGLLKHSLALASHVTRKWNRKRLAVFLQLHDRVPVKTIADTVRLSDKAVYKSIDHGALRIILRLLEEITTLLNTQLGGE